jgi:5,6,7,8-tetrahydromethanopterin hydro-lyase
MTQGEFAARTLIGESFAGSGVNAAHINIVIGRKGGPVETAWTTSLAMPRAGHIAFLTVLRPNLPVKPMTLFVNKADLRGDPHAQLTWGPAQAGVAIVAVWVDWAADDAALVFANNKAATNQAIAAAVRLEPRIEDVVAEVGHPWNASYHEHRN